MTSGINRTMKRRTFLKSGAAGLSILSFGAAAFARQRGLNEKLNLACIGITNRGGANVSGVQGENIIALCDIDDQRLEKVGARFKEAKRYFDFRTMLDEMSDKLDGAVVSTTDHVHAPAALAAMRKGLHCYCEKPLAHTIREVREMVKTAKEKNLVTQMGIQIHAVENYRRVVELIRAGAVGQVKQVYLWTSGRTRLALPSKEKIACPPNIHWDQWIGPAPYRDYDPCYMPGIWRNWWDFGAGRFGDMACHLTDIVFWSLGLSTPLSVTAKGPIPELPGLTPASMEIDYKIERPGSKDPLPMHWTIGNPPEILKQNNLPVWNQAILFIGSEGMLLCDYDRTLLFPENKYANYKKPAKSIPSSPGHHQEWIQGIKEGKPEKALCAFEYGACLTETVFLGNISWRAGQKEIVWDRGAGKITNLPEANKYLDKEYRKGWELF